MKEMIGRRFGKLTVVAHHDKVGQKNRWLCRCDCGAERINTTGVLNAGRVMSCGCSKVVDPHRRTHGRSRGDLTYSSWCSMRGRCLNPRNPKFPRYGGRGIKVCERWASFENFLADMGERMSGDLTIGRKDNDGDYEPGNCRWETPTEQKFNRGNNRRIVAPDGVDKTITEWALFLGVTTNALRYRIKRHGTIFI